MAGVYQVGREDRVSETEFGAEVVIGYHGQYWDGGSVSFSCGGQSLTDRRNIGGSTVHSWAGVGLGELPVSKLVEIINKNNITRDRWIQTGALIIDESGCICL